MQVQAIESAVDNLQLASKYYLPRESSGNGIRTFGELTGMYYYCTHSRPIWTFPRHLQKYSFGAKLSFIGNYSNALYYNKINGDSLQYDTGLSNAFNYTEYTQSLYDTINNKD
ncbi:MAG: hypothetical protein H0X41_11675 [Chitinophagaceae bacterium]|nr:hypothetical protein [Chitinophagaceae bacterium]